MRVSHLWTLLEFALFGASTVAADDSLNETEAIAKIKQLGGIILDGRPRVAVMTQEPVPFLVIPFWAIVVPLTLLSAYLLLTKPRSAKLKNADAPGFQHQV